MSWLTGLLGFIKLLIDILTAVIDAAADFAEGIGVYFNLVLEYLDNFWQAIWKIDLFDVAKTVFDQAVSFIAELPNAVADWVGGISVNIAELGYFIGYVGTNIAEFFIPVLKVAKLAKAGKFAAAFDEIAASLSRGKEVIANLATKVTRTAINSVFDAIDFSINLLRGGTKALKDFIEEVFEKLKKWLDEIAKRNAEALEKRVNDFIDTWKDKPVSGKGFLGSAKLKRSQILAWEKFLKETFDVELRFVETDKTVARLIGQKAAFFAESRTIWVHRANVTDYVMRHEMWHAEEVTKLGKAEYLRGAKELGGSHADDLIRSYNREKYVFEKIMENKTKFTDLEIRHAQDYFDFYVKKLTKSGIDPEKLTK